MISQVELRTQFKLLIKYNQPTGTHNNELVYPLTKTLAKSIMKDTSEIDDYIDRRLKAKNNCPIEDNRLREYQKQDVAAMLRLKRIGLFNEQRLGKTPTVLSVLKRIKEPIRALIIAPKSTHIQWEQETYNWCTNRVKRIRGPKKQRISYYNDENVIVYITTYETAAIDFEYLNPIINCVVLDEAHRIRNFKGLQSNRSPNFTKAIVRLAKKAKYVYPLTGTPAPNHSSQIFPLLHIMFPTTFPSYWAFAEYYYNIGIVYTKQGEAKQITTFINKRKEQEFEEFLNNTCIQRKRKDHMEWLPDTDVQIINLELDKKIRKWYNELYDTWECKELDIDCPNKLVLIQKLVQLTSDRIDGPKTEFILDYIKDYPEEQILITTPHTAYLKELHKIIPNSRLMIGDTSTSERDIMKHDFNHKKYQVLLGNTDVIKEGVTLEQGNTIIVVTPSFIYSDNLQVYDRIVPTNKELALKKDKQQIIKLICKDTIDDYLETQLNLKKSLTDIVNNFSKRKENSKK